MNKRQARLSEYVTQAMASRKMTQRELAGAVGVSHTYISKIVNGKCEIMPSLDLLCRMAVRFGDEPYKAYDAAGVYDRDKLEAVLNDHPELARRIRNIYEEV